MTISINKRTFRARGFTLLELMFTVGLAALLLGIAIPSFRGMAASNRLVTIANEMVGAVNFARSEAITRNMNMTLCRSASDVSTACAPAAAVWTSWIVRSPTGIVVRRGAVNTYAGTISLTADFTLGAMTFGADGLARTGGALVTDRAFTVCSTVLPNENIRNVGIGAGSRISVTKDTGGC
jgi:type IV fimbrial biogenesis protein FimT